MFYVHTYLNDFYYILNSNPIFEIGPLEPRFSEWLVFEGISVDEKGEQHYLDATIAYKMAVLKCIKYLAQFGFTEEQVYLLLSCCPCEGRISGIVDVPNAVCTLAIPLSIFDRDVRPPSTLEGLANGVHLVKDSTKLVKKDSKKGGFWGGISKKEKDTLSVAKSMNVCISTEGGAVPFDPRFG
jgi:hypothetical protein